MARRQIDDQPADLALADLSELGGDDLDVPVRQERRLRVPTRIICAIPRASLRSVLLICCAVSKAFMCRVSTQITGRSAAVNALTSHCDSGPASIPIRPKGTPSEVRRAMISVGSVGTCCCEITWPASSTTHTDVSFTDTSRPTKCAIASLLFDARGRVDLDPLIVT